MNHPKDDPKYTYLYELQAKLSHPEVKSHRRKTAKAMLDFSIAKLELRHAVAEAVEPICLPVLNLLTRLMRR